VRAPRDDDDAARAPTGPGSADGSAPAPSPHAARATGDGVDAEAAPSIDELFHRHLPDLTAYVRRRTDALVASRESSRDLVQSVCREVVEHGERFRPREPGTREEDFRRWLFRTAERKIIGRYRYYTAERRAASREHPLDSGAVDARRAPGTPSQDAIGRERLEHVEAALAALPEDWRRVIVMARMEELDHREIARRLGRSEGAVRNLLWRGLAALAEKLDDAAPRSPEKRA